MQHFWPWLASKEHALAKMLQPRCHCFSFLFHDLTLPLFSSFFIISAIACLAAGMQGSGCNGLRPKPQANSAFAVQLQQAIQECEKKGGTNASVP